MMLRSTDRLYGPQESTLGQKLLVISQTYTKYHTTAAVDVPLTLCRYCGFQRNPLLRQLEEQRETFTRSSYQEITEPQIEPRHLAPDNRSHQSRIRHQAGNIPQGPCPEPPLDPGTYDDNIACGHSYWPCVHAGLTFGPTGGRKGSGAIIASSQYMRSVPVPALPVVKP